jgi:hypothetical protein
MRHGAAGEVSAGEMAGLIDLICATEFDKSFQPIVPMVRIGGDTFQVTVVMGFLLGHGNSGTLTSDRPRALEVGGGWPQPRGREGVGAMP